MSEEGISLKLTRAEALVFFEWLSRNDEVEAARCDDPAEQQVLWKLEGQLEKVLVEPLRPDYVQLVAEARRKVNESG